MSKIILIAVISFFVVGCSMNVFFYFPDKNAVVASDKAEEIYIPYDKDKKIHALLFKKENPIASVFILHGNGGSLTGWQSVAEMLLDEGYQTFIFDYPEYGNSDGHARHNVVIEASQKAFEYFTAIPEVIPTKKIIMGFSLGANLALKIGPDNQDQLDAMVIEGGFTSYRKIGINNTPKLLRFAPFMLMGSKFKGEETIKSWTKPLLIVHSTEDDVIPYKMGQEIYKNAASTRKELWTIKGPHIGGFANYSSEYFFKIRNLVVE